MNSSVGVLDLIIALLRRMDVQPVFAEPGQSSFVLFIEGYPEVTISPTPWGCRPVKDDIIAFLQRVTELDCQKSGSSDAGFNYSITLISEADGRRFTLSIKRLRVLLRCMSAEPQSFVPSFVDLDDARDEKPFLFI